MSNQPIRQVWPEAQGRDPFAGVFDVETSAGGMRPHVEYRNNLIGWCVEKMGIPEHTLRWSLNRGYKDHTWDGTPDPMAAIAGALEAWNDVAVESGTGTGKSFFAALVVLWFQACWEGARVFTFAPKEDQLRLYIWMEIQKVWPRFQAMFPQAELQDLSIRMRGGLDDSWGARGYAVGVKAGEQVATKAAGMHAEHMLIVGEETPGLPPAVIAAHENTCTAPHNIRLYLGNPDNQQDPLHQLTTQPGVVAIRISALDHPNVVSKNPDIIPGAASQKSIKRRAQRYGEDSPLYGSRVRGIAPLESKDALIKGVWIRAAGMRYADPAFRVGAPALGADVANSERGDQAAICEGRGATAIRVTTRQCPDANAFGREVVDLARALGAKAEHVGVDAVGVGAGAVNEAKRLGFMVRALMGGPTRQRLVDSPEEVEADEKGVTNAEKFGSLRSAMYWQLRMDLMHGRIALDPHDEELHLDLVAPSWHTRGGVIYVEAKEDIKKRLGRSPNKGDAVVYWNWVRPRGKFTRRDKDADDTVNVFDPEVLKRDFEEKMRLGPRLQKSRKLLAQFNRYDGDYL